MRRLLFATLLVIVILTGPFAGSPERGASPSEGLDGQPGVALAQSALPPLPAGWPSTLQLGMSSPPGDASKMKSTAPFGFRYQYLAGGVNTGGGWATWNANGSFVTNYVDESTKSSMIPVFTYYMLLQSNPSSGGDEGTRVYNNLQNTATMTAYYNDLKLFFQRAGAFSGKTVVLHVEPDFWGYMQKRASGDNAAGVSAKVSSTGLSELAGLPDNVSGFARAIVKLRDTYAPNVVLGYHLSVWGTNNDISLSNPSDSEVDALGTRAGNFYKSLNANFGIAFGEFSDRDSAFKIAQYGAGQEAWWDANDFRRHVRFNTKFVNVAQKRLVMWQIPYGNTKMRAMNNTWNHYQDNRVEWLLDDPSRAHLNDYLQAGVVGFLFGRGADGATNPTDANGDGVTNPAPINGNTTNSISSDDDGGFFRQKAAAYYSTGAMSLPSAGTAPTSTPTPLAATATPTSVLTATPTHTPTSPPAATATRTPTSAPSGSPRFTTSAQVAAATVSRGQTATITTSVISATAMSVLVDVEIYTPGGAKLRQQYWDNQAYSAGQQRNYTHKWSIPANAATGVYTVKIGIFGVGDWDPLYAWNNQAVQFTVR